MVVGKNPGLVLFVLLACAWVGLADVSTADMLNNGDFYRVSSSMSFLAEDWQTLPDCQPLAPGRPTSSLGALVALVAFVHETAGAACYYKKTIFYLLSAIYFYGAFLTCKAASRVRQLVLGVVFFLSYAWFSFIFKSLYEEAAVFALSPWIVLAVRRVAERQRYAVYAASSALLLLAKSQMVFYLPVFALPLLKKTAAPVFKKVLIGVFITAAAYAAIWKNQQLGFDFANAYNRLFNGLGWSLQGVADWPGTTFDERRDYFQKNAAALQNISRSDEPNPAFPLFGTSFWPDGERFLKTQAGNSKDAMLNQLQGKLSFGGFLKNFLQHPDMIAVHVKSIFTVALESDYSLAYLRPFQPNLCGTALPFCSGLPLKAFGVLFYLGLLLLFAAEKTVLLRLAVAYYACVPLFVVIGDGYYEFEKHMLTNFMVFPAFAAALLVVRAQRTGRAAPATGTDGATG